MDFGSLISAGANILGGILGNNQADKNAQHAADIARDNYQWQKEFAQNGVQWKVADAKAAGINPLAALGASTSSFSNVVGGGDSGNALGSGVAAAGQDLGRAANALTSQETKQSQLEQKLLEAKIANVNADTVRQQAEASSIVTRHSQPGTVSVPLPRPSPFTDNTLPLYQDYRDGSGGRVTMLSHDASQSVMNAASLPLVPVVGAGLVGKNLPNAGESVIPSAASIRALRNGWQPAASDFYTPF